MVKVCISHIIQIVHGIEGQIAVYGLDRSINCHMDKITMNICYIIQNPTKLLQSEHNWMHYMDIHNTNTKGPTI